MARDRRLYGFALYPGRDDALIEFLAQRQAANWRLSDVIREALYQYAIREGVAAIPPVDFPTSTATLVVGLLDRLQTMGVTQDEIASTTGLDDAFVEHMRDVARQGRGRLPGGAE